MKLKSWKICCNTKTALIIRHDHIKSYQSCNYLPWELKYSIKCKAKQIVRNCRLKYFRGQQFRVFAFKDRALCFMRSDSQALPKRNAWEQDNYSVIVNSFCWRLRQSHFAVSRWQKNTKRWYFILLPRLIQSRRISPKWNSSVSGVLSETDRRI